MGQCNERMDAQEVETFSVPQAGFSTRVRTHRKLGWKRDLPDFRDRVLAIPHTKKSVVPTSVDLRPKEHFDIYDQGHLGSCTANAICAAFHFEQVRQGVNDFTPSRLFVYYNERAMEGSIPFDSGASIRDGIKSTQQLGVCPESLWPYDVKMFTQKPPEDDYKLALNNKCQEYARVPQTLEDMKACIAEGFPFAFGFSVFESFFNTAVRTTGIMPMPKEWEKCHGGHAVLAVGYDDEKKWFIVRNSWGVNWGDQGYFYMPYAFIADENCAGDAWAIRFVEAQDFPCAPTLELKQEK